MLAGINVDKKRSNAKIQSQIVCLNVIAIECKSEK